MSPQVFVATDEQKRRAVWEHLFGTDMLPVRSARPRWQHIEPGRHETLAFDLDVGRLHAFQKERLAAAVARTQRIGVEEARQLVETKPIPIPARGCRVLEE